MTRITLSRRLFASLVAGVAVAAVANVTIVLLFFTASGGVTADLASIAVFFAPNAVAVLVLVTVAGLVGWMSRPRGWLSLVAGVIAGLLAAYAGTTLDYLAQTGDFGAASTAALPTLVGPNLPFVVAVIVATVTLGRRVYRSALFRRSAVAPEIHRLALVRVPAATLAKGQVTHVKRRVVKVDAAERQWDAYVAALEAEGFTTLQLDAADEFPDSVFIEDTLVMLDQLAVITSPGAPSRRGEQDAVAAAVADLGLATRHIRLPGTLDGGDVLKVGETVYVGRSGRTNAEGIRQFREIARELGYTVVAVPVTKALHLKSTVTALPDGTVIGHPSLVDNPSLFARYLEVPEVAGVAVVVLSDNAVLISASAPKTAALIADLGYRVVTVDISEFEKLEGCVTCLSVRIG
jgi:dimethylargininase